VQYLSEGWADANMDGTNTFFIQIISKKPTAHSQNSLRVDVLYNIKRKKYKTTPQWLLH
jgi:hypothetical protein